MCAFISQHKQLWASRMWLKNRNCMKIFDVVIIHAIRDKVRFSSISFLKIVLHSFAQNNDLVRIFRSIFFALVDKLRTKS